MTVFHAAFTDAMGSHQAALSGHITGGDPASAGLSVYRNTAIKARIDALQANYPTVADLAGEDWFRAAASAFVAQQPGDDPAMAGYGAGLADWLLRFPPAREHPYFAPAARLDRAWTEAHLAADADPLRADEAARLGLALTGLSLVLHPSARVFWFDWTAPSLWLAHRYPDSMAALEWRLAGEGLLIVRPELEVTAHRLSIAGHAFLQAIRLGRPLGAAAAAAQGAAPGVNVSTLFTDLIAAGAFAGFGQGTIR